MATTDTFNYEASQLDRLEPAEFYRLQIRSDVRGETKWLNITPAQLAAIREILTGEDDEPDWSAPHMQNYLRDVVTDV
jgi:hypothetical protein